MQGLLRVEEITLILHHWLNSVHKEINQLQKSVLQVQVAYCLKFILDSTGNALEKDKLIQQTQQKKSAAFSHTQAAPPDSNGCIQMSKTFPKKEYKPLYLQFSQAHLALNRTQTLFPSQTGSLHTSDSDGFHFSRNFSKWQLQITSDAVSPLHLINKKHQESPQYWDAQNY